MRVALVIYASAGVLFAAGAAAVAQTMVVALAILPLVAAGCFGIWLSYRVLVWMFEREARQSVEISERGVREIHNDREYAFIPWDGVKEIEVNGTLFAGSGLRIKGNFSEITISNADLTINTPMGIREMHRAFAQNGPVLELLQTMKDRAPGATVKLNRLARRRLEKQPKPERSPERSLTEDDPPET